MIGSSCEHIWLIPPAALERDNWRKKYRIKCRKCSSAKTVEGAYAQRMVTAKDEQSEVAAPKPSPSSKRDPVEHDYCKKQQGWQGEYLFADGLIASGDEDVMESDTIILSNSRRYVVRKFVVPRAKGYCWIAEVERTIL